MRLENAKQFIIEKLGKELSPDLHYHSLEHVLDVWESALILADMEGISNYEKELLSTAALYHDSGFLFESRNHEERGCQIIQETLPRFGYTEIEIAKICGMVMATKIPQCPKNHLEEILCDADLDYLGRDDFWKIGNQLFEELKIMKVVETENDWNKIQIKFLESHHYFTSSSIELRSKQKDFHLQSVKELVV
ncbi:MAG: HD domain-containing protein [Bacteroidota bacterium]|nr:HD domain-containing protein [Bacteroidota bacterium]